MIIDNLIPKGYSCVDLSSVLSVDLIRNLNQRALQTKSFHLFKHDTLDSYIMVRVAFYAVHVRDFDSLDDLIDYLKFITEDVLL